MVTSPPRYAIDTCSLIELREHYPIDIFPSVWDSIDDLADNGSLISSQEVLMELEDTDIKGDVVLRWAKNHLGVFVPLDGFIQQKATEILSAFETLVDIKKKKSNADAFLIATAIVSSCGVVTEENYVRNLLNNGNRVKIPNVCQHYKIPWMNLLQMLRAERIQY